MCTAAADVRRRAEAAAKTAQAIQTDAQAGFNPAAATYAATDAATDVDATDEGRWERVPKTCCGCSPGAAPLQKGAAPVASTSPRASRAPSTRRSVAW